MIAPAPNLGALCAAHHPHHTGQIGHRRKDYEMTTAQEGLRSAIARRGKVSLSRLTGAEIAAQMTEEQKAAIREKLGVGKAPATATAKGSPWSVEIASTTAAKAATAKALAVMESPHFEARRDLAVSLLKKGNMCAEEICSILAIASTSGAEQNAALADLKAALADAAEKNAESANASGTGPSRAARIWESAYARTFGEAGE